MRSFSILAAAAAMALVGVCTSAQADVVTYDLNTPGNLVSGFHTPYTGTLVSQSTTGGLSNSGALDFRSGGGNQAWYSNASYAPLAIGQTLTASLYFQIDTNNTSSIKLGFASDPNSAVSGTAVPLDGSWAYLGAWTNTGLGGNLDYEVGTRSNGILADSSYGQYFVPGNWYKQELTMTKTAASTFDLSWAVYNSDNTGVLGSSLIPGSQASIEDASLDTTLYTFVGLENPTSSASHHYIDNISMTSTGDITVPEPASLGVLGLGTVALLRRRRAAKA